MSDPGAGRAGRHIHLDPVGGVAGDMFIAAVLDVFPDLREGMEEAIRNAGLPAAINIALQPHRDHALTGHRFAIEEAGQAVQAVHPHRTFSAIRRQLHDATLPADVCAAAIDMFTRLARAEARVHGMAVDEVSFHELGEWDSIADIVGAAYLCCRLQASWSVGPLPLGRGRVQTAHGPLPVPAPATALLLEGFQCFDDGVDGERVTPTGAAILAHIGADQGRNASVRTLLASGTGFGSRRLPELSNVLRVLVFEEASGLVPATDRIAEIQFEVDDQTAEDLAIGLSRLRAHSAVRDVLQTPAFGKKGRLTTQVRVLADPRQLRQVCDACLEETTTLGLRYQVLDRFVLKRLEETLDVDGRRIAVKAAQRSAGVTLKAAADDIARTAGGHEAREILRKRAGEAYRSAEED